MKATSHFHILIVDDDDDDRYIIDLSFRDIKWSDHIKLVDSGASMFSHLEILANTSSYPALILLDYNMPKMGAEEVLSRLKRHEIYQSIPVAVYSTEMTENLSEKLKTLGAAFCYKKPSDISQTVQLAETLKREAQAHQPAA